MAQTKRTGVAHRAFVILLLLVLVAACGDRRSPRSDFKLDLMAGSPARSATPNPLVRGVLSPGRYYTTRFTPPLVLTVPAGWTLDIEDESLLSMFRDADHLELTLLRRSATYVPVSKVFVDGSVESHLIGATRLRGSLAALAGQRSGVTPVRWKAVRLFGRVVVPTFLQWDSPLGMTDQCPVEAHCPLLVVMDPSDVVFGPDGLHVDEFIEPRGGDIIVDVTGRRAAGPGTFTLAEQVLASLRFAPR